MSIPLKEMKGRINNKYSVLPHLYYYSHLNPENKANCIFYELGENDDETDFLAKEVENTMITLFGADDFKAFSRMILFTDNQQVLEDLHNNITLFWRNKAKEYISAHLENEQYIKNGYFFMFLPKTL